MGIRDAFRIGTGGAEPAPKAVVAAAMPMTGPDVARINRGRMQQTQEQWQREAWYYFDAVGELRGPLAWIANAVSQAELHATTLDPDTGLPTGPSENTNATAVAAQAFGGAAQRAGLLRLIALCWQVCGEAWIIIQPQPNKRGKPQPDKWLVLSGNKMQARGTEWQYTDPFTGALITLTKSDRLIRVWCPHPDDQAKADSAVRPALPILREIEKASQNIAARLDSRIATNGIAVVADELSASGDDFMAQLMNTAELGLQNPGQASSQVPLAFNAPGELIANGGAFAHFDLNTEFDASVVELRTSALDRLASTLDMPKDVAAGTQGESNHWSAWLVSEDTYKIFIKPLLQAVGDAVTEFWFRPALVLMGESEDEAAREEIGWDTTAIVARPDDRETLESLYEKRLISDEYMLTESGVSLDAMPGEEERTRRFLEQAILSGVPAALLADPNVAEAIGLDIEISPIAAGVDAEVGAGGELEAPEPEPPALPGATPGTQGEEPTPEAVPEGLVAAAELIVYDALSRAGGRLLTNQNRGQFKTTPRHALHTATPATDPFALLEGSFQFTDRVADAYGIDRETFTADLHEYCYYRLQSGKAHDPDAFRRRMWMLVRP